LFSKAKFVENFTVCALDGMEAILVNTFLDVHCVDVLENGFKLNVITRLTNRSISLEIEYQASLAKVGIHLVSLQELQKTSFLIVDESNVKFKAKGVKSWPTYISNTINKLLDVLTDDLPKHLPHFRDVDHKIKVVLGSTPHFKSPYWLNSKKLQKFKVQINDLVEWGYIRPNKLLYGSPILHSSDIRNTSIFRRCSKRSIFKNFLKNIIMIQRLENWPLYQVFSSIFLKAQKNV